MPVELDELVSRISRIEGALERDAEDREERQQALDNRFNAVMQSIDRLSTTMEIHINEINRYKGLLGGITLAVSVLWGLGIAFKDTILGILSMLAAGPK